MDILKVLETGPMMTIQDLGRRGYQQYGVPVSGALDQFACRTSNLLVDNDENAAVLELTFMGATFEALNTTSVALAGAEMAVLVNDKPVDNWTSFIINKGDIIKIKPAANGLRGYFAVSGGFDVPMVMGSRSTYTGANLGGYKGRALAKGDVLSVIENSVAKQRSLPQELKPVYNKNIILRAVPGPQDDMFDHGLEVFFTTEYKISSKADRMGYRLEGSKIEIKEGMPKSIISEPSLPGAVQIPADGLPIILLVEQTVGGYSKIATVISSDLDMIAQARPGDIVRFEKVDIEKAHKLIYERNKRMDQIRAELAG